MASYIVYDTNKREVVDGIVSDSFENEQLKIPFSSIDKRFIFVDTFVPEGEEAPTPVNVYTGLGDFDFIDLQSGQTITATIKDDGTTIFEGDIKFIRLDYAGTKLTIDVINESGYAAGINILVSNNV